MSDISKSFLIAAFLLAAVPSAAYAVEDEFSNYRDFGVVNKIDEAPPVDEYKTIGRGLMMDDVADPVPAGDVTADEGGSTTLAEMTENRVLTIDEINEKYAKGQYAEILPSVQVLADNGHSAATEIMGIMYRSGQGTPKDAAKAFSYLQKAADQGRPLAEHHLGIMYFMGEGVTQDLVKSMVWLQIAVLHYQEGPEKARAKVDLDKLQKRLTRRDRERGNEMTRDMLEKRGEGHLIDLQ